MFLLTHFVHVASSILECNRFMNFCRGKYQGTPLTALFRLRIIPFITTYSSVVTPLILCMLAETDKDENYILFITKRCLHNYIICKVYASKFTAALSPYIYPARTACQLLRSAFHMRHDQESKLDSLLRGTDCNPPPPQ